MLPNFGGDSVVSTKGEKSELKKKSLHKYEKNLTSSAERNTEVFKYNGECDDDLWIEFDLFFFCLSSEECSCV